jgi:hypothetical protein
MSTVGSIRRCLLSDLPGTGIQSHFAAVVPPVDTPILYGLQRQFEGFVFQFIKLAQQELMAPLQCHDSTAALPCLWGGRGSFHIGIGLYVAALQALKSSTESRHTQRAAGLPFVEVFGTQAV